jgi:hypothetical protein
VSIKCVGVGVRLKAVSTLFPGVSTVPQISFRGNFITVTSF